MNEIGQEKLEELKQLLMRKMPQTESLRSAVPQLLLHRRDVKDANGTCMGEASVCLIVNGRKQVNIGERFYEYGKGEILVIGAGVPDTFKVISNEEEGPFLGISLLTKIPEIPQSLACGWIGEN